LECGGKKKEKMGLTKDVRVSRATFGLGDDSNGLQFKIGEEMPIFCASSFEGDVCLLDALLFNPGHHRRCFLMRFAALPVIEQQKMKWWLKNRRRACDHTSGAI
jgi:hypothetical protein